MENDNGFQIEIIIMLQDIMALPYRLLMYEQFPPRSIFIA
jgi:hypothetical protein